MRYSQYNDGGQMQLALLHCTGGDQCNWQLCILEGLWALGIWVVLYALRAGKLVACRMQHC